MGAYLTSADHPVYTTPTSLGLWLNQGMDHVAIIDILGVLDGLLSGAPYAPTLTTPQDIAYFDIPKVLSVFKEGTGGGIVTSAPSGIDCGAICSQVFANGTVVTLTATPDLGSTFEGWRVVGTNVCSGTGDCVVTMDGAKSVTATFKRIQYDLTVLTSGTGTGTVTSSPSGLIDCPVTCVASVDSLTVVTLSATPTAPSTFAGWSGPCTGTGSSVVTMDAAKTVTARFSTPPVADDQSVSTEEDTPLSVTLTATDADSDPLTYSVVSGPTSGTLGAVTGANVTYTPNANFNGTDSFTFVANDGTANSNTATVTITVTPVADAPVANSQSVSTGEDTPLPITLTATDGDGDPLTYSVLTGPTNGTLNGSAPNVTYTPAADFSGPDNFVFTVNDGSVESNVATVTITVNAVSDQ